MASRVQSEARMSFIGLRRNLIGTLSLLTSLAAGCVSSGPSGRVDEPPPDDPPPPLEIEVIPGETRLAPAPADFLFLVDRSASWSQRADRWAGLTRAISSFVTENEGKQWIAANAFPLPGGAAGSCEAVDYATLAAAWTTSPYPVRHFVDGLAFEGGSTLGPALEGTLRAAIAHAGAEPLRTTSVVLLTDATPGDDETCDTSAWDEVAAIARRGFHDGIGPAAHVHVISVVSGGISPDHFARIDAIAEAGSGYSAIVNGSRDDVTKGARTALDDIRARMTTCTFLVPEGARPEALTIRSPDGSVETATRVSDASKCDGATFYLDDPAEPRLATLCSGAHGVGGLCEVTFVRAERVGAPTVTIADAAE